MRKSEPESVCSPRAVMAAIEAAGSTVSECAEAMGLHRPRLSEALHGRRKMPAEWLDLLPVDVLTPIVARLAHRCGLGVVDLPDADVVTSDVGTLADLVTECADVTRAYADALRDGYITADEASRIELEALDAIRTLWSVVLHMRSAKRERVIGVAV